MTGVGDIPSVFQLCSAGRQFSNAVLKHTGSSIGLPKGPERAADDQDVHSFGGAINEGASYQSEQGSKFSTTARDLSTQALAPGLLQVRRLTEQQGDGNEAVKGGLADW